MLLKIKWRVVMLYMYVSMIYIFWLLRCVFEIFENLKIIISFKLLNGFFSLEVDNDTIPFSSLILRNHLKYIQRDNHSLSGKLRKMFMNTWEILEK